MIVIRLERQKLLLNCRKPILVSVQVANSSYKFVVSLKISGKVCFFCDCLKEIFCRSSNKQTYLVFWGILKLRAYTKKAFLNLFCSCLL